MDGFWGSKMSRINLRKYSNTMKLISGRSFKAYTNKNDKTPLHIFDIHTFIVVSGVFEASRQFWNRIEGIKESGRAVKNLKMLSAIE